MLITKTEFLNRTLVTETGKTQKAWSLYKAMDSLSIEAKSLTNPDTLAYLSGLVKDLTDSTTYDQIYYRYYPRMIFVEGGDFIYQKDGFNENTREFDIIGNDTTVSNFYIAQTETTVWQFYLYTKSLNSAMPKKPGWGYNGDNPIVYTSWYDSQKYIQWLSTRTKENYLLPGEAVWEYSARGGQKSRGHIYAGSDSINKVAWYNKNAGSRTHAVGLLAPNELGIYDLSGNIWEWCGDNINDSNRSSRGGSWGYNDTGCRVARRRFWDPSIQNSNVGFRIARIP